MELYAPNKVPLVVSVCWVGLLIPYSYTLSQIFLKQVDNSSNCPACKLRNTSLDGTIACCINFFTSASVIATLAHWLKIPSSCSESLLEIPITLWASSKRSLAFCVCLILILLVQFRIAAFNVLLQTIRVGVNASVMLPKPSCEVVRNKYFSIKSSLPT